MRKTAGGGDTVITKIQVVGVGRMKVPGPEVFWMERFDEELALTLWMVVVQTVDRVLLINTGVAANDTAVPELVDGIAGGGMAGLKSLGITAEQVTDVVITPLQAYAIGNADQFPRATIHLSRRGWMDYHAPPRPTSTRERHRAILWPVLISLWRERWPQLHLLHDEDTIIAKTVTVSWVGCHHRSSLVIWVQTETGVFAFTDIIFHPENFTEDKPIGIAEDRYECLKAYALIRSRADRVFGLYDPGLERAFPDGVLFRTSSTS